MYAPQQLVARQKEAWHQVKDAWHPAVNKEDMAEKQGIVLQTVQPLAAKQKSLAH